MEPTIETSENKEDSYESKAHENAEVMSEEQIVKRVMGLKDSYEQSTVDSRSQFSEIFDVYMGKTDYVQSTPYSTKDDIPKLRRV